MNDRQFLNWIADRFVNVYGESENVDFVQRLRSTAQTFIRRSHKPGESHQYEIECKTCGQRGMLNISIEPQRAAR